MASVTHVIVLKVNAIDVLTKENRGDFFMTKLLQVSLEDCTEIDAEMSEAERGVEDVSDETK